MIHERSYSSANIFGKIIFSEHLEKENMVFRAVIITFSHVNSANFKNNFKDNFMYGKLNKMASKAKTLNICTLEPN